MPDRLRRTLAALGLGIASVLAVGASASEFITSRAGHFQLQARPGLEPLAINRLHAWNLRLAREDGTPVTGATIEVGGGMPEHDHGLPTRPRVRETSEPGLYLLEGMRFHMHGEWRLVLRIDDHGTRDEIAWTLHL